MSPTRRFEERFPLKIIRSRNRARNGTVDSRVDCRLEALQNPTQVNGQIEDPIDETNGGVRACGHGTGHIGPRESVVNSWITNSQLPRRVREVVRTYVFP